MQKVLSSSFFFLIYCSLGFAQTPISGIINRYAKVSGIDTDCKTLLTVSDTTGFRAGAELLLVQMKGAAVKTDNQSDFGEFTALNFAGRYERALIDSVAAGEIYLRNLPLCNYDLNGSLQIVTIPVFKSAVVTDTLTAKEWDGETGGVLVLEVEDTLTLEKPVSVSGQGFRGGQSQLNLPNNCQWFIPNNDYYYDLNNWRGSAKGEGIADMIPGREAGKGAFANGGGGGNDHNAGGGGGANVLVGGEGGENDEPSTFGCRGRNPGLPGYAIPIDAIARIFMGGGGGAGHTNNNLAANGGKGGGIAIISTNYLIANNHPISANGLPGSDMDGDGAGGGGAAGTIILLVEEVETLLELQTAGGNGGTVQNLPDRCMGPGGGGSGGWLIGNKIPMIASGLSDGSGGLAGISVGGACGANESNGAENGLNTASEFLAALPKSVISSAGFRITFQPESQVLCVGDMTAFEVIAEGVGVSYQWQVNTGSGFQNLSNNAIYSGVQSPQLILANVPSGFQGYRYRCIMNANCISNLPSFEATLDLADEPEITGLPQDQTICEGQSTSFSLQAEGINLSYQWQCDNGAGFINVMDNGTYSGASTATLSINMPAEGAVYRCNLRDSCGLELSSASAFLQVVESPAASFGFSINGGTVSFTDLSLNADTWLWDFGDGQSGNQPSPTHSYLADGTYIVVLTVTNACGSSSFQETIQIVIETAPEAIFSFDRARGCAPLTVHFRDESSGNIGTRLWTFEGGNPATSTEAEPVVEYLGAGSFDVGLEVSNSVGSSLRMEEELIVVAEAPRADFEYTENGLLFSFSNLSQNADTYQWNFGDGSAISTEENPTHEYAANGAYTVTLIASNAFCAAAVSIPVDINIVSLHELWADYGIQVFPNPAQDHLVIERQEDRPVGVRLLSPHGQVLQEIQCQGKQQIVHLADLPAGLYLLEIVIDKKPLFVKIVKL